MKVAVLAACVALSAAGCGTSSSPVGTGHDSAPTTSGKSSPSPLLHLEDGSSSVMLAEQGPNISPPPTRYAVFGRKQTKHEAEIAPTLVADYPCSVPGSESSDMPDLGKPVADKARILLRRVGPGQDSLVAVPTPGGRVSVALFPDGSGTSCAFPVEDGLILAAEAGEGTATVYGMVDDRVRSVEVIVNGQSHRAQLAENGFALTLPTAAGRDVEKLVLHRADGSKAEFPPG
jgi:hypothetical protein